MAAVAAAIDASVPSPSFTIKLLPVSEEEPVVQIVRAEVSEQFGGFCWWRPDAVPGGAVRAAEMRLAAEFFLVVPFTPHHLLSRVGSFWGSVPPDGVATGGVVTHHRRNPRRAALVSKPGVITEKHAGSDTGSDVIPHTQTGRKIPAGHQLFCVEDGNRNGR